MIRAGTSCGPPGAKGLTKRIGRVGQPACANAGPASTAASTPRLPLLVMFFPPLGGRNTAEARQPQGEPGMAASTVTPMGHLETPWPTPADCPRNGRQPDPLPECRAVVAPE